MGMDESTKRIVLMLTIGAFYTLYGYLSHLPLLYNVNVLKRGLCLYTSGR